MNISASPGAGPDSEQVAARAERRWAVVVGAIIVLLLLTMVVTSLHWAAMPPSRVESIDPRTLYLSGEFMEGNLGSSVEPGGSVFVRLIGQQYSFTPQCLVVPAGLPVTFRATSADVIHGFNIGMTNVNTMLVPGFVSTFTTTFKAPGEHLMPCHEYCGTGHAGMWTHVQVIDANEFLARASGGRKVSCVQR